MIARLTRKRFGGILALLILNLPGTGRTLLPSLTGIPNPPLPKLGKQQVCQRNGQSGVDDKVRRHHLVAVLRNPLEERGGEYALEPESVSQGYSTEQGVELCMASPGLALPQGTSRGGRSFPGVRWSSSARCPSLPVRRSSVRVWRSVENDSSTPTIGNTL